MARRKSTSGREPPPHGPRTTRKPSRAFDLYLDRGLHKLFDGVIKEPIPDDILKLLRDDPKE